MMQVFIRSLFACIGVHSLLNCFDPDKASGPGGAVRSALVYYRWKPQRGYLYQPRANGVPPWVTHEPPTKCPLKGGA